MKIFMVLALLVGSAAAHADEVPVRMHLKRAGYDKCVYNEIFNEKFDCGRDYAEHLTCEKQDGSVVNVLVTGKVQSDAGNICNPVRVMKKIIEGKSSIDSH